MALSYSLRAAEAESANDKSRPNETGERMNPAHSHSPIELPYRILAADDDQAILGENRSLLLTRKTRCAADRKAAIGCDRSEFHDP